MGEPLIEYMLNTTYITDKSKKQTCREAGAQNQGTPSKFPAFGPRSIGGVSRSPKVSESP